MKLNLPKPAFSWAWIFIVIGGVFVASLILHFMAQVLS
jgi:hypothetical protein